MAGDTHLFLALTASALGEAVVGARLARGLRAGGDEVLFVAPSASSTLVSEGGVQHVPLEPLLWRGVARGVRELLDARGCRSLALIDAVSVTLGLGQVGEDTAFLTALPVPVVALDYWCLREAGLRWDYGHDSMAIPPVARDLPRRLLPAPVCRPDAGAGVYDALPEEAAVSAEEREGERRTLGLGGEDRLVLMASSRFWDPEVHVWQQHRRVARMAPELVVGAVAALGPSVHLVHVGPSGWAAHGMEGRYHWLGQLPPDRFRRLLHASDMLLSLNVTGTTTAAAIAAGVPVVAVGNSHQGGTVDEVAASLGGPPAAPLADWLARSVPLHRFRLFPLGLFEMLRPVLDGNPYMDALRAVELLDPPALTAACSELLFEDDARASLRERQEAYCRRLRALPSGPEAYRSLVEHEPATLPAAARSPD